MGKVKLRQVIYFICIRLTETSTALTLASQSSLFAAKTLRTPAWSVSRKWCRYKFYNYIGYSAFGSCYQVKLSLCQNPTSSRRNSFDKIELVFTVLTLSMHLLGLKDQRRNSVKNFYWKAFNPGARFLKAGLRNPG